MAVSQCGDLCRMGDAQDLMSLCALPQHLTDPSGGLAGNTAVDLIVDHRGHCIPVCQRIFDGKGDAAQLTAGGNAGQRFRGFTGVRGDVEFHAVLSVACQRPTGVVQRHAHTRHIQELQGIGNACIQLVKGFQTGLGQGLCLFARQTIQAQLFRLQLIVPLLRELDLFQFLPCFLSKGNDVLHRITVLAFETVQQIQPLFDLIQLGVVRVVGIQPVDQLCRCVLGRIVQVHQRAGHPGK